VPAPPRSPPPTAPTAFDVAALRAAEFPWTAETIYLNAASIGPLPERTRAAVEAFNRRRAAPRSLPDTELLGILAEGRRRAASLVGAAEADIALTGNTSYGINMAAYSLALDPGDIILVSDREFPANVYPWLRQERRGVTCEIVPPTDQGWPDEDRILERLTDPRVKVVAVSMVQFSNGYAADLGRLGRATGAAGATLVVDAIQGLGAAPLDLGRVGVDILACGGQKWLLSPWGTGFLYVRPGLRERLDPAFNGWMAYAGTDDFRRLTAYDQTLRSDARRFEMVTLPFQDFAGFNVSLELLATLGVETIAQHVAALHEPIVGWAGERGVPIASPRGDHQSAILCLSMPNAAAAHTSLREAGVVASLREGAIRLSPHVYNTLEEMDTVARLLDAALRRA